MNIAFLTPEYVVAGSVDGGLANYTRKTALQLVARGHDVTVFILSVETRRWVDEGVRVVEVRGQSPLQSAILERRPGRFLVYRLGANFLVPFITWLCVARVMARTVLKEHRNAPFDIVQTPTNAVPGFFLAGRGEFPVVCRLSSYRPLTRSALGRKRSLAEIFTDWLEVRLVDKASAAFAPCWFTARIMARFENLTVDVIRTPLDEETGSRDESFYREKLAGKRFFLFFGTLYRVKGADLLASVIPVVVREHPDILFVFIGRDNGMPGGKKVFDYICESPGVPESNVRYFPALPKPLLYPVIENALAVLMPSRADNYPNACLETLSMGTPVIATNDSSLEEMVVEGKTGFLAENGAPESIARAVGRCLAMTGGERAAMKERIASRVDEMRREDRLGALLDYYGAVIGEKKA